MKTPQRLSALHNARQTLRNWDRKITRIKKRLESLTSEGGVSVDAEVQEEIEEVIEKQTSEIESLPGSDFRRIFWEQQLCYYMPFMYCVGVCTEDERADRDTLASTFCAVVPQSLTSVS